MRAGLLSTLLSLPIWASAAAPSIEQYLATRPYLENRQDSDPVPASDMVNQSGQFPDGSYACTMEYPLSTNDDSSNQCNQYCVNIPGATTDGIQSVACVGLNWPNGSALVEYASGAPPIQLAKCVCNIPLADEIINDVILALPAIASIGCEILFDSFNLVLQIGLDAIPGEGELSAGIQGGISAASQISSKLDDAGQVASSFLSWFGNPCGNNNYTNMVDQLFDPLVAGASLRGLPVGKGRPPKDPDEPSAPAPKPSDPAPTKEPEPSASAPKTSDPAPTSAPKTSDPAPTTSAPKTSDSATSNDPSKSSTSSKPSSTSSTSSESSSASSTSSKSSSASSTSSQSSSASSASSKSSSSDSITSSKSSTSSQSSSSNSVTSSKSSSSSQSSSSDSVTSSKSSSSSQSSSASSSSSKSSSSSSSSSSATPEPTLCSAFGGPCGASACQASSSKSSSKPTTPKRAILDGFRVAGRSMRTSARESWSLLKKRAMPTPAGMGGMQAFMVAQFNTILTSNIIGNSFDLQHAAAGQDPSTGLSRVWSSLPGNAGVQGLYGCTSLIVTSREGTYLTHFFENPSFTSYKNNDFTQGPLPAAEQQAQFTTQVLDVLDSAKNTFGSNPNMPALESFISKKASDAGSGAFFYPGSNPKVVIAYPTPKPGQDYTAFVGQIQTTVTTMLAGTGATFKLVPYTRAMDTPAGAAAWDATMNANPPNAQGWLDWLKTQAYGKALVQWAPTGGPNNNKAYAVYVGDDATIQAQDNW